MSHWRIAALSACAVFAILTVGCSPSAPGANASLPWHELDLSAQPGPPAVVAQPRRPSRRAESPDGPWACEGYRPWRYVVIHHSATDGGNAGVFDEAHRGRGWDELGYHFVIDNGNGGPDGQVEVGSRWRSQKWGAHCRTPGNEYNLYGIGICLVGDFSESIPSEAQLASLRRLVSHLSSTYDIPPYNVIGHCDAPGASTECPGRAFVPYVHATLRTQIVKQLASGQ